MITGQSANFTAMVGAQEQSGTWRVQITLPGGVYPDVTLAVDQLHINASTTSDLPSGTRLEVGYPSIAADFTLSGLVDTTDESKTAAWLFGQYSTSSPLYRSDALYAMVTVDLGLNPDGASGTPEPVRKFTGVVDSYTVNSDGSVQFTCIDLMRQLLRSVLDLPAVTLYQDFLLNGGVPGEYVIDAILRSATGSAVSTWPALRSHALVAAGLCGSVSTEAGSYLAVSGSTWQSPPTFAHLGSKTCLLVGSGKKTGFAPLLGQEVKVYTPGTYTFHVEVFLASLSSSFSVSVQDFPTASGFNSDQHVNGFSLSRSGVNFIATVDTASGSQTQTVTALLFDSGYVCIDWTVTIASGGGVTWAASGNIGGSAVSWGSGHTGLSITNADGGRVLSRVVLAAGVGQPCAFYGLQWTTEATPASNAGFVPRAVLDASLNLVSVIPAVSGDPYQVIQQLCDAELGVAGGDESGVFRFFNRNTLRTAAVTSTLTSSTALTDIGSAETSAASVVNRAVVEYTSWNYADDTSIVWEAQKPIEVKQGRNNIINVTTDQLICDPSGFGPLADGVVDTTFSAYRASTDKAGNTSCESQIGVTVRQLSSNSVALVVSCTRSSAWLVGSADYTDIAAGTPLLWLAARAVTPAQTLTADFQYPPVAADGSGGAKSTRFGEVAFNLSGNPFIQDADTANQLAQDIVTDMANPRPNLTAVGIVPDPRIQLGDVTRIQDSARTGMDEYARVFGWDISWQGGDQPTYDMTLDARTLAPPGGWLMGFAGRSEIGSTAYVYASA